MSLININLFCVSIGLLEEQWPHPGVHHSCWALLYNGYHGVAAQGYQNPWNLDAYKHIKQTIESSPK